VESNLKRHAIYLAIIALLLLVIEVFRESAIVDSPSGRSKYISAVPGGTQVPDAVGAEGAWLVTNGEQITPHAVKIWCYVPSGECREVYAQHSTWLGSSLDVVEQTGKITSVNEQAISYQISEPLCAEYIVTIDYIQKRAFSQRRPKEKVPSGQACDGASTKVIEMDLRDGLEVSRAVIQEKRSRHFLPVLAIIDSVR
jgi:hypothetical protein